MSIFRRTAILASTIISLTGLFQVAKAETLTIATVNNHDIIEMQKLTDDFKKLYPDTELKWVTLEENILRQRVTTDIATNGGQYDVMTIGNYEIPLWAKYKWLTPLDDLGDDYHKEDLLPIIRGALTYQDKLYAVPFYGESAMIMYRKDLMKKAGLEMPHDPSWDFIAKAARKITDKENGVYGICLRGKSGWGENTVIMTTIANAFGARWFDEHWNPQFDQPEWKQALTFYLDLMKDAGPRGATSNGFNENLALFQTGKCGIWLDATVAASFVSNPKESDIADQVGYALAPDAGLGKRSNWLWVWSLAVPSSSHKQELAKKFVAWATSKHYMEMIAEKKGWRNVPPGTRISLYENKEYQAQAPFAKITYESIKISDQSNPTVKPVPYTGIQFVTIPEFQGVGTLVGQQFSSALAGQITAGEALKNAQYFTLRAMKRGQYFDEDDKVNSK